MASVTTRRVFAPAMKVLLVTDVRFSHVPSQDVVGTEYVIPIHIVVSARKIMEVLDVQWETPVRTAVLDTVYVMQILRVHATTDFTARIVPKAV